MSNTPHELHEEFPEQAQAIHTLKAKDAHFARLVNEYHDANRAVHRAETRAQPISAEAETALRHTRMRLKDDIWKALQPA
jgi:uncharacterized protein YdcH (DUF465 family)